MKLLEAMLAWDPGTDRVKVGPWPDQTGWSDEYQCTSLATYTVFHENPENPTWQIACMAGALFSILARDGISFPALHREMVKIDEYRGLLARTSAMTC